jgi:GMP synthase-like glutamine amidotransferase
MGGPMGAYEDDRLPWLKAEKQLISDAVTTGAPFWGVCLGSHSDTFELPEGAVQLARSNAYEQQAFVFKRAYGVQFHIEVGTTLATQWSEVPAYADSLTALMGERALPRLLDQIGAHEDEMTGLARRLFAAWLERVVGGPRHSEPPAPGQRHSPTPAPNRTAASTSSALL